jgi:phospholipase C
MDGFVLSNNPDGARAMGYYDCDDIPFFYWLANTFAISDHHFSSLLGPTWPNRLFTAAATSCGFGEGSETDDRLTFECGAVRNNLFKQLKNAGVSYRVYDDGIPSIASLFFLTGALTDFTDFGDIDDFESSIAHDTLPAVSIIEPHYQAQVDILKKIFIDDQANDDHPPADIQRGQQFVYRIVKAVASNPAVWGSTALFITYDEHGGFYDHVPPPPACDPEGPDTKPSDYRFNRYGFRVPLIVVSPYAKGGYVSQRTTDHTSILRFIQAWKGLPALTWRDANAWPMLDLFDFQGQAAPAPDLSTVDVGVTAGRKALCHPQPNGAP